MSEYRLPWHEIHEVFDRWPLAETVPRYVQMRGEWEELHSTYGAGEGIKVGIGDTGVDRTHMESGGDLAGTTVFDVGYGKYDAHSHGTFTTSQVGARGQGSGMIGMAPKATLFHAKVLSDGGSGSSDKIARGIDELVDAGCTIVSLSLGGGYSDSIERACKRATDAGVIVIASLGNSGERGDGHPGNSEWTVGSAAIDYEFMLASFSSRSNRAECSDFGVQVYGAVTGGRYGRMSGTSMSCPNTAGCVTLIQGAELKKYGEIRTNSLEKIKAIIRTPELMRDLGPNGHDRGYGYGYMELRKILDHVLKDGGDPPLPPTPPGEDPFNGKTVHIQNSSGLWGPYELTLKNESTPGAISLRPAGD